MLVRACVFSGLFHAPFSAFFEVLTMSLGQICVRGCRSLVNSLKIMSDVAFSIKYRLFSANLPGVIAKISSLFKRFAWKTSKKVVSVNTVKFLTF